MDHSQSITTAATDPAHEVGSAPGAVARIRSAAWGLMVAADVGLLVWAAMAAFAPDLLIGPRSMPILPAGYEGFTGGSWPGLTASAPKTAEYLTLLFRMYGLYGVAFSLVAIALAATAFRRGERWAWWALLLGNAVAYPGAMVYDQLANAVGPFEALEYVALAAIVIALAVTARRSLPSAKGPSPTP